MIQFNLLPDVKLQYIKTHRRKRFVTVMASSVVAGSLAILILLFLVVNVLQKQHLAALSKDINTSVKALQDTPNLDRILTVQNQLQSLGGLHDQKPVTSRLFGYLSQITPAEVSISDIEVNFTDMTMKVNGASDSLTNVNKFVDTLKFTNFSTKAEDGTESPEQKAFSSVVLTSFGRSQTEATYSVELSFSEVIFDNAQEVRLIVPQTITTRSETEKPLFQELNQE